MAKKQQLFVLGRDGKRYEVEDVSQAQAKWIEFRDQSQGGASQIGNGVRIVDQDGKFVARVSYNGRVWDTEDDGTGGGRVVSEAPEPAAAAPRTVQVNEQDVTLSSDQAAQWDDADRAAHEERRQARERAARATRAGLPDNPDVGYRNPKEQLAAELKAIGMRLSARRREIAGVQTTKEQKKATEEAARLRSDDAVEIVVDADGNKQQGTVTGTAFGKVRVRTADGVTLTVPRAQVRKVDAAAPAPQPAADAGTAAQPAAAPSPAARTPYPPEPPASPNRPAYLVPAQRAVVDFMNGDITREQLHQKFAELDMAQGPVSSVTNRIEWFAADDARVQELRKAPATQRPARTPETENLISLRKRESVLRSLLECLA